LYPVNSGCQGEIIPTLDSSTLKTEKGFFVKGGFCMETVLRKHRRMARLTLRALEAETGIALSRLSRMENRREELWKNDIARLRQALPTLENVEFVGADRLAM